MGPRGAGCRARSGQDSTVTQGEGWARVLCCICTRSLSPSFPPGSGCVAAGPGSGTREALRNLLLLHKGCVDVPGQPLLLGWVLSTAEGAITTAACAQLTPEQERIPGGDQESSMGKFMERLGHKSLPGHSGLHAHPAAHHHQKEKGSFASSASPFHLSPLRADDELLDNSHGS